MKQNIHNPVSARQSRDGLYYLFYPGGFISLQRSGWIIIAMLLFSAMTIAQEQTPPGGEFIIGSPLSGIPDRRANEIYYNSFGQTGFNTVWQYAKREPNSNQEYLQPYNLIAFNHDSLDWIGYYSTCYYTRWEAEQNQTELARVGVKNNGGEKVYWDSAWCWSTSNIISPTQSFIYGPHYRQDNRYKSWPHGDRHDVRYYPRFRMGLENQRNAEPEVEVCRIKVVYSYRKCVSANDCGDSVAVFREKILTVGDFQPYGHLKYFYFDEEYYKYPPQFHLPDYAGKMDPTYIENYPTYEDSYSYQGIQFVIDWIVGDPQESGLILYVDHIEVFDRDWKNEFLQYPGIAASRIEGYANEYSGWSNLRYWYGHDEPYSIDAFTPIRIVDSILAEVSAPRLTTAFNPYWTWDDSKINGDTLLSQYVRMANPEKLWIDFYPFSTLYPFRFDDTEALRFRFQLCHTLRPGFWYMAQTFGEFYEDGNNNWIPYYWRYPEDEELNATVMLALVHGSKGIFFWIYDSWKYRGADYGLEHETYYQKGLVDTVDNNQQLNPTPLWYHLKDSLVPRLNGKLGKTLMSLNYSGNFLKFQRRDQESPPPPVEYNYLTLSEGTPSMLVMNWHCGFFDRAAHPYDNYFMLANLITTDAKNVKVTLKPPVNTPFTNYRFRNIEGLFDTTFSAPNIFEMQVEHNAGEGYLYQVAPVILYGGKLIFDDSLSSEKTLVDDLIIKNGKTLTINATYNADRSITIIEGGRLVTTTGGTVKFYNNQNLIIEGTATISGTPQHKLVLDFLNPAERNGIIIKPGGSLTIVNCEIRNAGTGIFSELNANYLSAQNVDFINCADYSINISGRSAGMNPTPPPQINGCTMLNSNYGIAISNSPGMVIYDNDITNTACGIYLSNVTDAQVIGNTIISNREEIQGIILLSSGGAIRANLITGHTLGLQLANSSPILGSNVITANKYHGLHIGDGSLPYMRMGSFIGNPPNFYATSGYNKIFQNGEYEGEGDDNDGSEIYFVNSNAEMDKGCNSIYDDREPSPPLVNTYLLMNCSEGVSLIEMDARINYWGSRIEEGRFGNLRVNYIPYSESPCPEPQDGSAGELVRMTSFGDVIDTVFAIDIEIPDLSETEEAYAEAEEYFLTGNLTNALQIYESIISSTATEEEKYPAYQRKYAIGKLTGQSVEYFNQLSNTFATLASNTQDTLNKKILNQLSTLSKVGEQEYETAIAEFDNIVQQNPNTEEAVYAEIDALTTALLLEEADSTLQKGRLGKYLIKSSADYNQRIDEILRKHFGSESKENQKELIPTEYTLYQNYPNPFNPVTTIKYDLPNTSDVSLIIYDILGRKVKELVNTKQQAGRYEIQFDATNLASGVYIYQIIAEKYISSKKMILLK